MFGPRPSRPRWQSIGPETIGPHLKGRNGVEDGHRRGFLVSRGMGAPQRTGEENEPAVADADRAEHREAVFGQTCPIETAVDVPAGR
ncbi:hypothetical protein RHEC894_PB00073 (plasmid) [Rhizobium sp. CIAT894]|nr:hypothetical protein RHEC894_PB00073 [Rhizobium sp. CIAT894]